MKATEAYKLRGRRGKSSAAVGFSKYYCSSAVCALRVKIILKAEVRERRERRTEVSSALENIDDIYWSETEDIIRSAVCVCVSVRCYEVKAKKRRTDFYWTRIYIKRGKDCCVRATGCVCVFIALKVLTRSRLWRPLRRVACVDSVESTRASPLTYSTKMTTISRKSTRSYQFRWVVLHRFYLSLSSIFSSLYLSHSVSFVYHFNSVGIIYFNIHFPLHPPPLFFFHLKKKIFRTMKSQFSNVDIAIARPIRIYETKNIFYVNFAKNKSL